MYPKKKFDRDNRYGPKRSFGGPRLFSATCVECGNECQVPFQPTGNRPVFCRDCFKNQGEGAGNSAAPSYAAPSYAAPKKWESRGADEKLLYPAECDTCHNNCKVPFKPTPGRPVYCHRCMAAQNGGASAPTFTPAFAPAAAPAAGKMSEEQFKILNTKLDKLLGILEMVTADLDDEDFEEEEEFQELPEVLEAPKKKAAEKKTAEKTPVEKKPTRGQVKRAKRTGKTK